MDTFLATLVFGFTCYVLILAQLWKIDDKLGDIRLELWRRRKAEEEKEESREVL